MFPQRRSIRLRGFDYSSPGAYFITVCCAGRQHLLARVVKEGVALTPAGEIVTEVWDALPRHFPHVETDAFIVMPNHIHGVLVLIGGGRAKHPKRPDASPLPGRGPVGTMPGSLSAVVQNLKAVSARRIHRLGLWIGVPVWQRGFYERVVRDEGEWTRIRRYIEDNPLRWSRDRENRS